MFPKDLGNICVFYALSPLHAGSGQAIGVVDLPIQRERHTGWPHVQASGVKGAFRDWFYRYYLANGAKCPDKDVQAEQLTEKIFGRAESGEESGGQAGAISVSDARLLAFPVRSNVAPFVWVTCSGILTRLNRDLKVCLIKNNGKKTDSELKDKKILIKTDGYITLAGNIEGNVVLEDLAVSPETAPRDFNINELQALFTNMAPQIDKLLLISDQNFNFLVQTATEIQPQIRIDIATGTAQDGSLRYQELLPSDSVLYSLVFFAKERIAEGGKAPEVIRDLVKDAISTHIQMGGDVTLGRGLMEVRWLSHNSNTGGAL